MKKNFLIILVILSILQPIIILSKTPPNNVIKRNYGADLIVIGEIYDKGAALLVKKTSEKPDRPPLTQFIVLKVIYVIKGDGKIKPNSLIHILPHGDPENIHDPYIGYPDRNLPVQAERENLVIVYADPVPNNPGFYSTKTIFPFFSFIFFVGLF